MKSIFLKSLLGTLLNLLVISSMMAQTVTSAETTATDENKSIQLLGKNLDLFATIEAFKKSENLDQFELALNTELWGINNLDLNKDDLVDYLTIHDIDKAGIHNIVISAQISKKEQQDVAVIEIAQTRKGEALLQIIGHEEFYGENMIVEPFEIHERKKKKGSASDKVVSKIAVNVWEWPIVKTIFASDYSSYRSAYRFGYNHRGYKPWAPKDRKSWMSNSDKYAKSYYLTPVRRSENARTIYEPYRMTSSLVQEQNLEAINQAKNHVINISDIEAAIVKKVKRKEVKKRSSVEYIGPDGKIIRLNNADIKKDPSEKSPHTLTPDEREKATEKEKKKKN